MNDIITEINQELREERGKALWKKYGVYVIGFAVAVVAMVSGRQGLVAYQDSQRLNAANAYVAAINEDGNTALNTLAAQGGEGYPMLARFAEAGRLAEAGDAGAEDAYLVLSRDEEIAPIYRDAATVMSVMNAAPDTDTATQITRIADIAASEGPWQHVAIEMMVGLHVQQGNLTEARKQLQALRSGQSLSAEMNQRIVLLESALGEQ